MVRRWIWIIAAFFVSAWTWSLCSAETITFKSGRTIEGTVIEKTDEYIKVDSDGKIWKILYRQMDQQAVDQMQGRDRDPLEGKPAALPQGSNETAEKENYGADFNGGLKEKGRENSKETGLFPVPFYGDLLPLGPASSETSPVESSLAGSADDSPDGFAPFDSCIHNSDEGKAFSCYDKAQQKKIDDSVLELILRRYCNDIFALDLGHTSVTDNGFQHLVACSHLVSVSLRGLAINGEGLQYIGMLPNLKRLDLTKSDITSDAIRWLEGAPSLKTLILLDTNVTDATLEYIVKIPNLEELNLEETSVTDASISRLGSLKKLRVLVVEKTRISEDGVGELRRLLPVCQINPAIGR